MGGCSFLTWRMRVEPALARALDRMAGDKLVDWTKVSDRIGVILTDQGKAAAKAVRAHGDVLVDEKVALTLVGPAVTEAFVGRVISMKG